MKETGVGMLGARWRVVVVVVEEGWVARPVEEELRCWREWECESWTEDGGGGCDSLRKGFSKMIGG